MNAAFTIPGRLPGMNEILKAYKGVAWFAGARQKKKFTEVCSRSIVAARIPAFTRPVIVTFRWIEPDRRRDRDNIQAGAKFIMDAIKQTRRIQNDTRKWVLEVRHLIPDPDKENPRIEVEIEEVD